MLLKLLLNIFSQQRKLNEDLVLLQDIHQFKERLILILCFKVLQELTEVYIHKYIHTLLRYVHYI